MCTVCSSVEVIQLFTSFHFAANRGLVNDLLARSFALFDMFGVFVYLLVGLSVRLLAYLLVHPFKVRSFVCCYVLCIRFVLCILCSFLFAIHAVIQSSLSCTAYMYI